MPEASKGHRFPPKGWVKANDIDHPTICALKWATSTPHRDHHPLSPGLWLLVSLLLSLLMAKPEPEPTSKQGIGSCDCPATCLPMALNTSDLEPRVTPVACRALHNLLPPPQRPCRRSSDFSPLLVSFQLTASSPLRDTQTHSHPFCTHCCFHLKPAVHKCSCLPPLLPSNLYLNVPSSDSPSLSTPWRLALCSPLTPITPVPAGWALGQCACHLLRGCSHLSPLREGVWAPCRQAVVCLFTALSPSGVWDNGQHREGAQSIPSGSHGICAFEWGLDGENTVCSGKSKASGPSSFFVYTGSFPNRYPPIYPCSPVLKSDNQASGHITWRPGGGPGAREEPSASSRKRASYSQIPSVVQFLGIFPRKSSSHPLPRYRQLESGTLRELGME